MFLMDKTAIAGLVLGQSWTVTIQKKNWIVISQSFLKNNSIFFSLF